jgi:hypothetical protein
MCASVSVCVNHQGSYQCSVPSHEEEKYFHFLRKPVIHELKKRKHSKTMKTLQLLVLNNKSGSSAVWEYLLLLLTSEQQYY